MSHFPSDFGNDFVWNCLRSFTSLGTKKNWSRRIYCRWIPDVDCSPPVQSLNQDCLVTMVKEMVKRKVFENKKNLKVLGAVGL